MSEFKLPELGENVRSGTVTRVMVAPGKPVAKDQPVVEVETDKAAIEVPSTVAGTVKEVRVKAGDKVSPGQVLFTLEGAAGGAPAAADPPKPAPRAEPRPAAARPASAPAPRTAGVEVPRGPAHASPAVRRLARELGVDVAQVAASGPWGRVTAEDVRAAAGGGAPGAAPEAPAPPPLPDFSKWGPIERQPLSAVRRATAEQMARSWSNVPHVTHHDRADVTEFERLRKDHSKGDVRITVTAVALKIVAAGLKRFPQFASSLDLAAGELVTKRYCHIGVAVDTDRGLLVPVIRDADKKNILELSKELSEAAAKARARKLAVDDMRGGVFTITNLGGIGGTSFSPIVNWPEVAILGMSRSVQEPVWKDGAFQPRLVLPLSLSFDHRVIDGADAARFMRFVCEAFQDPMELALEGF